MIKWLLKTFVGTYHDRERKRLWPIVEQINRLEPEIQRLTDAQLREKTGEFRTRLQKSLAPHTFLTPADPEWYERNHDERVALKRERRAIQQQALDAILPEVFAVVREVATRTVNMRHFDVQLLGGIVLHEGKIAEMTTGEGKTLVATLAAYLNALTGRGVHIVTVNDFLARRDARWMGPIYHALGLSIGVIQGVDPAERRREESLSFLYDPAWTQTSDRFQQLQSTTRREAYATDITYGQNNEFGFDYLRDNMRFRGEHLSQREFHYAIVDEVDSILIDEARTPLIISGPTEESTDLYVRLDTLVQKLDKATDYEVEEKERHVGLTEAGIKRCEELLGIENLYEETHMRQIHHIQQALRAHELYKRDVDYMVKDDEIIIVDEFTGRLMPGRRWSDGMHQAIEAKEGVSIQQENQTLASVTFQNYFRMYEKLAGMTGTASTEAEEFRSIYTLDVVAIPTNVPLLRHTFPDVVYKTEDEKFIAVVQEVVELYRTGQPVLIGTISIEKSEHLSRLLHEPGALVKRLGDLCQRTLGELKKESVGEELRARVERALSRPAVLSEADAAALHTQVTHEAEKSTLVYRLEDIVRLVRAIATIRDGLTHNVLNAKYHEQEARIIAQAGRKGAVTIATNMAGRGTDILLGGNPTALAADAILEAGGKREHPLSESERKEIHARFAAVCAKEHEEVVALGGLHILATERHEARRIDNQLRGRSGRQGDPGSSRFYLSFADDLMRVFGSERIAKLMEMKWFQWEEGMPIEHRMVTKAIESAQRRIEGQNFDYRKALIEYDNTMNRQREVIYEQRRRILEGVDLRGLVHDIIVEVADHLVESFTPKELRPDAWDLKGLREAMGRQFGVVISEQALALDGTRADAQDAMHEKLVEAFRQAYEAKGTMIGPEAMPHLERAVLLQVMDVKWKDHLYMMDALREDTQLHRYGQRDPVVEYQHKAYPMFRDMIESVKMDSLALLLRVQPVAAGRPASVVAQTPRQEVRPDAPTLREAASRQQAAAGGGVEGLGPMVGPAAAPDGIGSAPTPPPFGGPAKPPSTTIHRAGPKIGRNDPCHCGSKKKFKKCHGR